MVSNASDDFPEPDSPVNTINWSRGSSRSTLRRLCSRAPRITIVLLDETATGRMIPGPTPDRTDVRLSMGGRDEARDTAGVEAPEVSASLELREIRMARTELEEHDPAGRGRASHEERDGVRDVDLGRRRDTEE